MSDDDKCPTCGTKLELSYGWSPTYGDTDNSGYAPESEPFCPKCDKEGGE